MSLTSDADIWMFISSNGGLTAGRKDSNHAVFPYYTDDKITDLYRDTGSKTVLFVNQQDKKNLWLPFNDAYKGAYGLTRNLYKNAYGNKLIFEEINNDLGLCFQYSWLNSKQFGIIKKSELFNLNKHELQISLLDGIQNLLPSGISENIQQSKSNLANAYKKNELAKQSGIGIYSLSSNIIDRPEPSEALLATTVCFTGLDNTKRLLCNGQLMNFQNGDSIV